MGTSGNKESLATWKPAGYHVRCYSLLRTPHAGCCVAPRAVACCGCCWELLLLQLAGCCCVLHCCDPQQVLISCHSDGVAHDDVAGGQQATEAHLCVGTAATSEQQRSQAAQRMRDSRE